MSSCKKYCNLLIKNTQYKVIIGGDFNTNVLDNNSKTSQLLKTMSEYNLSQHIKDPTHFTQTSSTCLDLIFTYFDKNKLLTKVEELGFCNHAATTIQIESHSQTKQVTWYTEKRFYN